MADSTRLQFALRHLQATDWAAFEQLAGAFLSEDFPELRTVAGIGDEGRDAVLSTRDHPNIVVQYSIAEDWERKIKSTLKRLSDAGHDCSTLIYVTSREIGSSADRLKAELLTEGVTLDVRDRSYFVERVHHSDARRKAAQDFADRIVNPLLPTEDLVRHSSVGDPDLRAGLLYLELQLRDTDQGRNISRLSYDSLVLAALRETEPDDRRTRDEIIGFVRRVQTGRDSLEVTDGVNGALMRLRNKRRINVTGKDDSFNLQATERQRRDEQALELVREREVARQQLVEQARSSAHELQIPLSDKKLDIFVDAVETLFEQILERQGNLFAEAVRTQTGTSLHQNFVAAAQDLVTSSQGLVGSFRVGREPLIELLAEVSSSAFLLGGSVQSQLRELADAYTLLAFMREAPDVQRAVSEFFSRGRLVLDTTALLPCFFETLSPENEQRYTNLLRGAQGAGIQLFVTEGVCNEINSHLNRAIACARRSHSWEGEIPLIYAEWLRLTGGGDFSAFVKRFRGDGGEDDIQLFLEQGLGIEMINLESVMDSVDMTMRAEVTELWRPRKKVQRGSGEMERDILLRHDVEMYFGVLGLRRGERRNMYGYEAWWVTEDRNGLNMFDLARKANLKLPSNPCLSPSFLANMLSIGPPRSTIDTSLRRQLPVALTLRRQGFGEAGLYSWADEIRAEFAHEPEWRIRQRIRQRMNELKTTRAELSPATAIEPDDDGISDLEVLTETVGTDHCDLDAVHVSPDS
jgi:hypothetical protein